MALVAFLYPVATKIGISYPILLVVAGLVIGIIPSLPNVVITPDIVFLLFLPPLLFDAARHTSIHDFRKNADAIGRLAIGLTLFTTAGVAVVAHYMIPGFTWPLAFALGAIVSPPDAVAAAAAIKGLHLPKRIVAILEGESLINDATALIAYRYAVVAVVSGTFVLWEAGLQFVLVSAGGIAIGFVVGYLFTAIINRFINNATVETILTLIIPFMSWLVAEHVHLSGVLAVVTTGLVISWRAPEIFLFQTRMQVNSFWDTFVFLLNGFVFILIGLQLPVILEDVSHSKMVDMIWYGLLISGVVIIIRMVWIFPTVRISDWFARRRGLLIPPKTNGQLFIIGWSGMRGVISLATALALPLTMANGEAFPERNTILFITFVVILVTLVFQGLTLPLFIKWFKVGEPPEKEMLEERRLRLVLANSTLSFVEQQLVPKVPEQAVTEVLGRLERQVRYLNGILDEDKVTCQEDLDAQHDLFEHWMNSEQAIIDHQRDLLIQMHKKGAFSAEVLKRIEQDLDSRSLTLEGRKAVFH
ncbi:MAG: Na+/H+ antiporter [Micavibrio aeruginosavorus]|uniref:Na+/H+ antiporter n=1 Tax=Micavibrio aeruginosavorus TaxID=349221 RepID=A0A2W5N358_9BACT|nr:MAG: Na+/H+ antiporter [Micavibrio aeruginosavorus]